MKKYLTMCLVVSLLLSGCGYDKFRKEEVVVKAESNWGESKGYELTNKNSAYMYNDSIVKLLAFTQTGESFTYMIPKFHNYSQLQEDSVIYDAYLNIDSGDSEEVKKVKGVNTPVRVNYTFRYLTSEQYFSRAGNWLLQELFEEVLPISDYDTTKYDSYSAYVDEFKQNVSAVYQQEVKYETNIKLRGEDRIHDAIGFYLYKEVEGTKLYFPCATYYWKLNSGNYLSLHIEVSSKEVNISDVTSMKESELNKNLVAYRDSEIDILSFATDISDYVLVGDFSDLFQDENPTETPSLSVSDIIKPIQEKVDFKDGNGMEVSSAFEELEYNRDVQGYFEE